MIENAENNLKKLCHLNTQPDRMLRELLGHIRDLTERLLAVVLQSLLKDTNLEVLLRQFLFMLFLPLRGHMLPSLAKFLISAYKLFRSFSSERLMISVLCSTLVLMKFMTSFYTISACFYVRVLSVNPFLRSTARGSLSEYSHWPSPPPTPNRLHGFFPSPSWSWPTPPLVSDDLSSPTREDCLASLFTNSNLSPYHAASGVSTDISQPLD